jgi:hypothetical protein
MLNAPEQGMLIIGAFAAQGIHLVRGGAQPGLKDAH